MSTLTEKQILKGLDTAGRLEQIRQDWINRRYTMPIEITKSELTEEQILNGLDTAKKLEQIRQDYKWLAKIRTKSLV